MNYMNEKKRLKAGLSPDYAQRDVLAKKRGPMRFPNPLGTLIVVTEKEAFCILFYASIIYAGFYAIISGMPSQLKEIYGYNDLIIGLMYLPISGGSLLAAFTQGKLIDWSYQREARRSAWKSSSRGNKICRTSPSKRRVCRSRSRYCTPAALHDRVRLDPAFPHERRGAVHHAVLPGLHADREYAEHQHPDRGHQPASGGHGDGGVQPVAVPAGRCATALILPMTNAMGWGWTYTLIGLIYVVFQPVAVGCA